MTLPECATITGIIQAPTKYCPLDHLDAARARRDVVLDQMTEQGSFPASIWAEFMRGAGDVRSRAVTSSATSKESGGQGQVLVRICEDSLQLANNRCPHTIDIYLEPGLVPTKTCSIH